MENYDSIFTEKRVVNFGKIIKTLVNNNKNSGFHLVHWNATNNQIKSVSA